MQIVGLFIERVDQTIDAAGTQDIRKIRPAVVISLDTVGRLPLRIVVPLTDWQDPFAKLPWFVQLPVSPTNGLTKDIEAVSDFYGAKGYVDVSTGRGLDVKRIPNTETGTMDLEFGFSRQEMGIQEPAGGGRSKDS